MAIISGRILFDRERTASAAGLMGINNALVILRNIATEEEIVTHTDINGNYSFVVANGSYSIQAGNPPISYVPDPPTGATNLDSITPNTLFVTVDNADYTGLNFLKGPVIYKPIQLILDDCVVILDENLIDAADGGSMGTFPQGTYANTGVPNEPYSGVVPDFNYVLPDSSIHVPDDGQYTVQNIMNDARSNQIGAWWRVADHTTGDETGRMMVVNGHVPGSVFFRDEVAVKPNTRYMFSAWILNLFKVPGYADPALGVRITDPDGNVLYDETLGKAIPVNQNAPEWKQVGSVIGSKDNDSLTVEFLSEGPAAWGNDYVIDDIRLNEVLIPVFVPEKYVNKASVIVGETVTYTVTLKNTCQSPLTNITFKDAIPDGLSFIPNSLLVNGEPFNANPNNGFALPDIPGGGAATVIFSAIAEFVPDINPTQNTAEIIYFYTPVEGGIAGKYDVDSNEVNVKIVAIKPGRMIISACKTAIGAPLPPGRFEFGLFDEDGKLVGTATNTACG